MIELSGSNIISHWWYAEKNECELWIGYVMIIGKYPMINIGLISKFSSIILKWYGTVVPMKYPIWRLGNWVSLKKDKWVGYVDFIIIYLQWDYQKDG